MRASPSSCLAFGERGGGRGEGVCHERKEASLVCLVLQIGKDRHLFPISLFETPHKY